MSSLKIEPRIFSGVIALSILVLLCGNSFAAEKVFIKEYTYQASEIDSKVTSRAQALEQAKRLVLEELGTYLMSKTEVKDFAISSDKVTVLTAGVVQTEIFDEKWNGETYYLKARITADPDEVAKAIDRLRKDESKTKELEDVKKRADEALKEIARLKTELDTVRNDKTKQLAYASTVNALSATDWSDKGMAFYISKDYDSAIAAFSKAIQLDSEDTAAYNNRGFVYKEKGQLDMAIKDFTMAISLNPYLVVVYKNRGATYVNKGLLDMTIENYNKAIEDYSKAIALEPGDAEAYKDRGFAYRTKGQYNRAIEDFDKAISLKPDFAEAYVTRGYTYERKREEQKAITDYKKACQLSGNLGCEQMKVLERGEERGHVTPIIDPFIIDDKNNEVK